MYDAGWCILDNGLPLGHYQKLVWLLYLAGRTNTSSCYELLPLLSSKLDLETLVSLCQASKQLHDQCLDLPDQQLQSIVQQALKAEQLKDYEGYDGRQLTDADSYCRSLGWLLTALAKRWGIMQLAARLDLQQALLAAKSDSLACYMLIRAGARITRPLLLLSSGPYNVGPVYWAQDYQQFRLFWDLPLIFLEVLQARERGIVRQVLSAIRREHLDSQLLYELAALVAKVHHPSTILSAIITAPLLQTPEGRWTPEQLLELALLAAKRLAKNSVRTSSMIAGMGASTPLLGLLLMPSAQGIPGRGYADLLVLLFSCEWVECMQQIADRVIPRVQWHQQLIEQIAAAVESLPEAVARRCRRGDGRCSVCILLQALTSSKAFAQVSFQQQVVLFTTATSAYAHRGVVGPLLQAITSPPSSTQPAEVLAAVSAVLDRWRYCEQETDSVLRLLQHQTVQQLQPAEAQLLLQKAIDLRCTGGLQCLVESIPAARGITVEALQQLLKHAIGERCHVSMQCLLDRVVAVAEIGVEGLQQLLVLALDARGTTVARRRKVVAALVNADVPAVQQLGPQELQLLLVKCIPFDDSHALGVLMDLPAAKQMPVAAACELMLQAISAGAVKCLPELLQLVPQMEQVPSAVLHQVLERLMKVSCAHPVLTPASMAGSRYIKTSSSGCAACSLLKAAAGKLAAADVLEVLVAAARAPEGNMHISGLGSLPGVDGLGEEQVEQVLLAAIEALQLGKPGEKQPLWQKLEQLQGELLYVKQLPAAAVHRLMVACVGKTVEGGVGRLREVLGEGPLGAEEFGQLLEVATRFAIDHDLDDQTVDCRPCLLTLAKLLPSVREKQQVVEGLRAAAMECRSGQDGESDLDDRSTLDGESDFNDESNEDEESDMGGESDLDSDGWGE